MNLKRIYPQYLTFLPLGVYLLFFIVPSLVGFYFAFTDWNPFIEGIHFVGFANFAEILTNKSLGGAAWNTISFTVITTILKNGFGLLIAIILNQQLKSQNLLRTIYFLPIICQHWLSGCYLMRSLMHKAVLSTVSSLKLDSKRGNLNGWDVACLRYSSSI
ncbi:carbohydrate ABC transporter permease [Paenibacillus sp. N3.4]|uniref:carbohydrate ABC transporter permease n=1 Tax=Paenibacillus sp. N3.4 TaxID=2603222 RepID=UPI0021C40496|nr:hypothetical protein [Paenibacillus sp. N3.4]